MSKDGAGNVLNEYINLFGTPLFDMCKTKPNYRYDPITFLSIDNRQQSTTTR